MKGQANLITRKRPRVWPRRMLRLLARCIVILPLLALGGGVYAIWQTMGAEAARALEFHVQIAAQNASHGLATEVLVLREMDRLIRDMTDSEVGERAPDLHRRLAEMVLGLPQASDLFISDGSRTIVSARYYPPPIDDPVRSAGVRALEGDALQFYAAPASASASGPGREAVFGLLLLRPALTPGVHGFLGVSNKSVYFEDRWGELGLADPDAGMSMSLVRSDGMILLGVPAVQLQQKQPDSSFIAAVRDNPRGGIYHKQVLDQNDAQIIAYRKSDAFPVYVVGTLTHYALVRGFVIGMLPHLFFSFTGALLLACLRLTKRWSS